MTGAQIVPKDKQCEVRVYVSGVAEAQKSILIADFWRLANIHGCPTDQLGTLALVEKDIAAEQ
jgi:hypothetical protein